MRIKRFEAASTQSAMAMVKEELGEDAVILSTRTISEKSGSGRGKPRIEVVAAMEYDLEEPEVVLSPVEPEDELLPRSNRPGAYGYHSLRQPVAEGLEAPNRAPLKKKRPTEVRQPGLEPGPKAAPASPRVEGRIHLEANDLRLRFANFLKQRYCPSPEEDGPSPGPMIFGEAERRASPPDPHQVAEWRDRIIDQLRIAPLELATNQGPMVVALIGPTGVGKTTTAAKLAAWYSIHEGLRVTLLSMDCYRIGATDQLRTYARIMRIPCEIALRKKDLKAALSRHQDKDLIIVDTAGKSPYDPRHIDELRDWFALCAGIAPYLVLSATSKKEDLQHIFKVYEALPVKGLVLSKLDETRAYAALCQQLATVSLPISCLCIGQRVPEDFLLASRDFLHALFGQGWQAATGELAQAGQGPWGRSPHSRDEETT